MTIRAQHIKRQQFHTLHTRRFMNNIGSTAASSLVLFDEYFSLSIAFCDIVGTWSPETLTNTSPNTALMLVRLSTHTVSPANNIRPENKHVNKKHGDVQHHPVCNVLTDEST